MRKFAGVPEMLEEYMAEKESTACWVTVGELRNRFGFPRYQCTSVSRFLRRLHEGAFREYPFIVEKIEQNPTRTKRDSRVSRYLVHLRVGLSGDTCCPVKEKSPGSLTSDPRQKPRSRRTPRKRPTVPAKIL